MSNIASVLQMNSVGIVLMIIVLFSLIKNFRSGIFADRLYFLLSLSIMAVCIFEILGTVFNGTTFTGAHFVNRLTNAILFAVNPIPAFLWALYANCKVYENDNNLKRTAGFLSIPLIIVFLCSFANIFVDVFFTIDANNLYKRTDFFFLATLLSVFYILYVIIIVLIQWKNLSKQLSIPLLSFMILPLVGLTLQFLFFGYYFLWVSISISVIIIFNHVQNDYSITDWLTGIYNRKHLDSYLQQMCKRKRKQMLVGFMFDIDDFKTINDNYGHLAGDEALRQVTTILRSAMSRKDYLARFAGDEFVLITQVNSEEEIIVFKNRITQAFIDYNKTTLNPFRLDVSIGQAVYLGNEQETRNQFLARMDSGMYEAKNKKR